MRRVATVGVVAAMVLLSVALPASAKGPEGATIDGDGVAGAIVMEGPAEPGQGTPESGLAEVVGFFPLAFGSSANVTEGPPTQSLGGSRMTIAWDMGAEVIIEEVYLDAAGGPVAYMAPGQPFWEDWGTTEGGWFGIEGDIASPLWKLRAKHAVTVKALQGQAPTGSTAYRATGANRAEVVVIALGLVGGLLKRWRRRQHPMPKSRL